MATFLFDSIVFGPVRSRRLGVSLGINLLPVDRKICSFNCIYCECGWTLCSSGTGGKIPTRKQVSDALEQKLREMKERGERPDVITYAGNGEPTMHPYFAGIIDDSLALRDRFFPEAKVSVLSNGFSLGRKSVRDALMKVDMNILKLDSAFASTVNMINQPHGRWDPEKYYALLEGFNGKFIIQTLFVRGIHEGQTVDNTTPEEVDAWLEVIGKLKPQSVMIYTIERDTPLGHDLKKVPLAELNAIAARVNALGVTATVSG